MNRFCSLKINHCSYLYSFTNKRYLQNFPDELFRYAIHTNEPQRSQSLPRFSMKWDKFSEYRGDICEYCKGTGVVNCLECKKCNKNTKCHKCNDNGYIECCICGGSGANHRLF